MTVLTVLTAIIVVTLAILFVAKGPDLRLRRWRRGGGGGGQGPYFGGGGPGAGDGGAGGGGSA